MSEVQGYMVILPGLLGLFSSIWIYTVAAIYLHRWYNKSEEFPLESLTLRITEEHYHLHQIKLNLMLDRVMDTDPYYKDVAIRKIRQGVAEALMKEITIEEVQRPWDEYPTLEARIMLAIKD